MKNNSVLTDLLKFNRRWESDVQTAKEVIRLCVIALVRQEIHVKYTRSAFGRKVRIRRRGAIRGCTLIFRKNVELSVKCVRACRPAEGENSVGRHNAWSCRVEMGVCKLMYICDREIVLQWDDTKSRSDFITRRPYSQSLISLFKRASISNVGG